MKSELMFPKTKTKKKLKTHKDSILQKRDGTCYLCGRLHGEYCYHEVLQSHHIFGGFNRDNSEAEGLKVYLCLAHHTEGPEAVHRNAEVMRLLQRDGQQAFEEEHSREEFMLTFGKNYL